MIDYISLLEDYSVDYSLDGANVGNTYIGLHCPWCDDTGYHGGVPRAGYRSFSCWKCGSHSVEAALSRILGIRNIAEILAKYEDDSIQVQSRDRHLIYPDRKVIVPGGKLEWYHKKYLAGRRYDPDIVERDFSIQGTEPLSSEGPRVYFPIVYNKEVISYQGRSIRKETKYKYLVASPDYEKRFHKSMLYNIDNCTDDTVVMVEGIFDVMRLGKYGVCASFGTSFMPEQLLLLKPFKRIFMLYDSEGPAQEKARKAGAMITNITRGDVYNIDLGTGGDPDDLSNDDAVKLMADLRRRSF